MPARRTLIKSSTTAQQIVWLIEELPKSRYCLSIMFVMARFIFSEIELIAQHIGIKCPVFLLSYVSLTARSKGVIS